MCACKILDAKLHSWSAASAWFACILMLASSLCFAAAPSKVEVAKGVLARPLEVPVGGKPGFTRVSNSIAALSFTNLLALDRVITNQVLLNGSGVALGDVDGDGWCDVYFCALDNENRLFRNLGNWKFEDVTTSAGLQCPNLDATGAVFADLDGDGDLDLWVSTIAGGTFCFVNAGQGKFIPASPTPEMARLTGGTSIAMADIDGDGDLDVYQANYRPNTLRDQPRTNFRIEYVNRVPTIVRVNGIAATSPELAGRFYVDSKGRISENGEPDVLYRNQGNIKFEAIPFSDGNFLDANGKQVPIPYDWGLSAMFRDINGDGAPDLYVCNDFDSPDRIWLNLGDGRFKAASDLAFRTTSKFSMGVDFADINRDGLDDIFVLDMLSRSHITRLTRADRNPEDRTVGEFLTRPQVLRNTLHLNRGDGTYAEIGRLSEVAASEWSWSPMFIDVDLDGYEDLVISTGHARDDMDKDNAMRIEAAKRGGHLAVIEELRLRRTTPPIASPLVAFRNKGDLSFEDASRSWGFTENVLSHGMAMADLDNDGDLDLAVNHLNSSAGLYRNDSSEPRVVVRLRGESPNTQAIGARITLSGGAVPEQGQEVIAGGRYLSGDDSLRVFAAGKASGAMKLEVKWRNGKISTVENVRPNHLYEVAQADIPSVLQAKVPPPKRPMFEDVSDLLAGAHRDDPFDDFARQPSLRAKLSQLGPGAAWFDVDGDGWEDLAVAGGKSGALTVFRQDGKGAFQSANQELLTRDQAGLLGWVKPGGERVILAGLSNYEDGLALGSAVREYQFGRSQSAELVPASSASTGPLAMSDIDGDGDLDLFVGGRVIPGRYPEVAASRLYLWQDAGFKLDAINEKALAQIGLVSAALWSDLDDDADADLVIACEWGPIKVLRNHKGKLEEITPDLGLDKFMGWWTSVASGDFDGDGRMDIAAGNWGLNSKYRPSSERPIELRFADLDNNGTVEAVETYWDESLKGYVPYRDYSAMTEIIPAVKDRISSYRAFASSLAQNLFAPEWQRLRVSKANELRTAVFLNRGGKFAFLPLPVEAQFAPVFGITVADFDLDGNHDIFLAQNCFAVHPESGRSDAGAGLLLRGAGNGTFTAFPPNLTGIRVYGEQRGTAVCDYDHDGRLDLAVTQNGNRTKLFRNISEARGIRVRLAGPPQNREAVGARIRPSGAGRTWPASELQSGSGHFSRDDLGVILPLTNLTHLSVRWPGGKTSTVQVPEKPADLIIRAEESATSAP